MESYVRREEMVNTVDYHNIEMMNLLVEIRQ